MLDYHKHVFFGVFLLHANKRSGGVRFYITMAKTSPINPQRSAHTTTTKDVERPPTRGAARGAKKKTKNKLSSQSDDDMA